MLGDRLTSRKEYTQNTEIAIKLNVLNQMIEFGRLKSYQCLNREMVKKALYEKKRQANYFNSWMKNKIKKMFVLCI